MHAVGLLVLAAATVGDGFGYGDAGVGMKKLFRPHLVSSGPAPPGGMMGGAGTGCQFGHAGCTGGAGCPGGGGAQRGRRFPSTRSRISFLDPEGMKIGWQASSNGPDRVYLAGQLTVPARYNFTQGFIYRLKLTDIPGRPGAQLYPTIEVAPSTPATDAYLSHNPIPVQFTAEDFDQVIDGGNFVTKVIYLPDPKYQELAIAGVETLVSTRLEPGVDPILEADKRGTILLIVRVGAIDLEMPSGGTALPSHVPTEGGLPPGTVLPPGALPPGAVPAPPPVTTVPLETAPVTPVAPPANIIPPTPSPTTPPGIPRTQPVPVEQPGPVPPVP